MSASAPDYILTLRCADAPGLVARITTHLRDYGGNIIEAQQFNDQLNDMFFMRIVFARPSAADEAEFMTASAVFLDGFAADWELTPRRNIPRVLVMVSKFDHCLADLLYRQRIGELPMEIAAVVCNHSAEVLAVRDFDGARFYHLPITADTKSAQEARVAEIIDAERIDLVVLARYMQILSDDMAGRLAGRCINIHHSFLPGFKGAKPYHQAYARGVKMIGATAHYVTAALDEGPIITQDVEEITHADSPDDLIRKGRDIERRVLAQAVGLHLERRIIVNGTKTVVFM